MPMRLASWTAILLLLISSTTFGADLGQKADTKAALTALETWLRPNKKSSEGWSKYLDLAGLHAQIDASGEPDAKVLQGVLDQLNSGTAGLEMSPVRPARARPWPAGSKRSAFPPRPT